MSVLTKATRQIYRTYCETKSRWPCSAMVDALDTIDTLEAKLAKIEVFARAQIELPCVGKHAMLMVAEMAKGGAE